MLPEFWQNVSKANPILYMVNAFRYGILGTSDIGIAHAYVILLGFIVLLFSGCMTTPVQNSAEPTQKPDESLAEAAALKKQGKWASAITTLQQANASHPDSPVLKQTLSNLQQAWQHEKKTLYQRLLVSETRALLQQQIILNNIAENSPADIKAQTALLIKNLLIKGKLEALNNCVAYQKAYSLKLARNCGQLINEIEQTDQSLSLYNDINQAYRQALQQNLAIQQRRSETQLLKEAEALIGKESYVEAQALLEELLQLSPDNRHAQQLLGEIDSTIRQQATILFNIGDQLYRDGQLEQAIAVWESLLNMTPDNPVAKARIERAKHVISKLQSLRSEQSDN